MGALTRFLTSAKTSWIILVITALAATALFALAGSEDLIDFHSRTLLGAGKTVDDQNVALGNSELSALGLNGGFHK